MSFLKIKKSLFFFTFIKFLLLSALCAEVPTIVVPVYRERSNSRPSHFNWKFQSSGGGAVRSGQFACGSYWVAPASGDSGVKVLSISGNPQWNDLVSCDADPVPERHGLLSGSKNYGSYDGSENIIPKLPITYSPASNSCVSLVAAMQRNEAETGPGGTGAIKGEVVDAYCVITVLNDVPANWGKDMIRPNITGETKEFLTWSDFDLSRIPAYSFIDGQSSGVWGATALKWRHSVEIFGGFDAEIAPGRWKTFSEGGRAFRAHNLNHDYAAGVTQAYTDDLLAMFSDDNSFNDYDAALAAMLSYALDIYHARYDYGQNARQAWSSGAGQHGGKFLPSVLLASLLKDESKANELRKVAIGNRSSDRANGGPQELRQISRGQTGVLLWGDNLPFDKNRIKMNNGDWRYWTDFTTSACYDGTTVACNASKGAKNAGDPYGYIDGPANSPGGSYMTVSFGGVRGLAATMVLMPEIRSIVNTDDPIEYADRVTRHGIWSAPDPVAAPPAVDHGVNKCRTWYGSYGCTEWQKTWGPNPHDIRFAIENGKGRFTRVHGQTVRTSFEVSRAVSNWEKIMDLYDGDIFEENAVALKTVVTPELYFETGKNARLHAFCPTIDSTIRYTLDGSEPTESSAIYLNPVPVSLGVKVRAKAFARGYKGSRERSKTLSFGGGQPSSAPPSVPGNLLLGSQSGSTVTLSWDPSSDDVGIHGYFVYANGLNVQKVFSNSAVVSGLKPGEQFHFQVSAIDSDFSESRKSNTVTVLMTSDSKAPSVPVALTTSNIASNSLTLRWTKSFDESGIQEYYIYSGTKKVAKVTDNYVVMADLDPRFTYEFSVSACDYALNESARSESVFVKTPFSSESVIVEVFGSGTPLSVLDGNIGTYWEAKGNPQAILFELDKEYLLDSASISFFEGDTLKYYFDIEVSLDGSSWERVYEGQSSGFSNDLESFDWNSNSAKFVRIVGRGNSNDNWIRISDVVLNVTSMNAPDEASVLSLGKVVTASSTIGGNEPKNAVDSQEKTRWESEFSDTQWIDIDLGGECSISEVLLDWEGAYGKSYKVEVSFDRLNWQTIHTEFNGNGGLDSIGSLNVYGRYVRIQGLARGTQWGYSLYDFKVLGEMENNLASSPVPPEEPETPKTEIVLLSANKSVVASSSLKSNYPNKAVDLNNSTRWESKFSDGEWIYLDLGSNHEVEKVELLWEGAFAKSYRIEVSDNAVNWKTVHSESNGNGNLDSIVGIGTEGRYVRMYGEKRGTEWGISLYEFKVFGWKKTADSGVPSEPEPSEPEPSEPEPSVPPKAEIVLLSTNKNVVASSSLKSNSPNKAVDLNRHSRWESKFSDGEWIYLDLGSNHEVEKVELLWEGAFAKSYRIEVSDNAVNWKTVHFENNGNGGLDSIIGIGTEGRYVRMYGVKRGTEWGFSLYEFRVYGASVVENPSTPDSEPLDPGSEPSGPDSSPISVGNNVFASSFLGDNKPEKVADSSGSTRWESKFSDNQWIYMDLGSVKRVNQVVLNWETAHGKSYRIETSENASDWNVVYVENNGNGGVDSIDGLDTSARYVRMYGVQRGTQWGFSLYDFKVIGWDDSVDSGNPEPSEPEPSEPEPSEPEPSEPVSIDLSLDKEVYASSVREGRSAERAVDSDGTTRWESDHSNHQWLYVDLGENSRIFGVLLDWETAYGRSYRIEVSDDAKNWNTVFTESNGNGGIDEIFDLDVEGRYVRMYGEYRGTPWGFSLYDFKVFGIKSSNSQTPPSLKDLSANKQMSASSVRMERKPENAVDGNVRTRWESSFSDHEWLAVDLGRVSEIDSVLLNWEGAYGKSYHIQVSNDGSNWTTVHTETNGNGGIEEITGLNATGRFVRLYGFARGTPWGYSLYELKVVGY